MKRCTLLLAILIPVLSLRAQVGTGEAAPSSIHQLTSLDRAHVSFPAVTDDRIDEIMAFQAERGGPDPFAHIFETAIDPQRDGTWTDLPNGDRLWRLRITADAAHGTILYYRDFALPEGSKLFLYTPDGSQRVGAITPDFNMADGGFATQIMEGEDVIIEYLEPASARGTRPFVIEGVASMFRAMDDGSAEPMEGFDDSDPCQVNVNCSPEGDEYQDEKRGVAMLASPSFFGGFTGFCTGSLVNNTSQDCTPYFLSAFHCVGGGTDYSQLLFIFNWEANGCSTPGSSPGSLTVTGSTMLANSADGGGNSGSDFLLVELNDASFTTAANAAAGNSEPLYFNGWDASGTASPGGVGIHHPSGDIKKISTYTSTLTSTAWGTASGSHWRVFWSSTPNGHGVTEGGSSGSPIMTESTPGNDALIVGTLTGGASFCTNTGAPDQYGKMSYHWNSNGTANNRRLDVWLDPVGGGSTTIFPGIAHPCSVTPTLDAGIDSVRQPIGAFCDATVTPEVLLRNDGTVTLTSVEIRYRVNTGPWQTFNWSGSLNGGGTELVTLPAITAPGGVNTFETETRNPNGGTDADGTNDDATSSFEILSPQALPLQEGFEGTAFPPATLDLVNPDGGVTFERTTDFPGGYGTSSASMFVDFWNYDSPGAEDAVLTDFYDISSATNPYLTFDYAYTYYDGPAGVLTDTLVVGYSDDCGDNFFSFFYEGGDSLATVPGQQPVYDPAPGDWTTVYIPLSGISNPASVQFFFLTISGWGNTLAIDNINLFDSITSTVSVPVAEFSASNTTICAGESVTLTDLSSNVPTSWSWTLPGGTTPDPTVRNPTVTYAAPGVYDVTLQATNSAGTDTETKSNYITVTANPVLGSPTASAPSCNGGSDGSFTINAVGGGGGFSFTADGTTQPSATFSGLTAGTYGYTVTDANGCTAAGAATINPAPVLSASTSATPATCTACDGSITVTATGGAGGLEYSLTGAAGSYQSSNVFSGLCAGNYTISIRDANDCVITRTRTVTTNDVTLTVTVPVVEDETCGSGNGRLVAVASGGTPPYDYQWVGGPNDSIYTGLSAGGYTVDVTDANGCTGSSSQSVTDQVVGFTVNTDATPSSCTAATGTVSADVGGSTAGYSFAWSTGDSGPSQSGYAGGTYTVTVTNTSTGCSETATATINELNAPVLQTFGTDPSCDGVCDGSVRVEATGGAGGNLYVWDDASASITDSVGGLCAGTYSVTVTDAAGCSSFASSTIMAPPAITLSAGGTDVTCFGGSDGTLTASATGGSGGFGYAWSGGLTGNNISGVSADTVTVTATDDQGCSAQSTVIISQPAPIALDFTVDTPTAGITAVATGGNGGFGYAWSGGLLSGPTQAGLADDTYTVTATDALGCAGTASITLDLTSIDDLAWATELMVYPNPVTGDDLVAEITLERTADIDFVLHDMLGKRLQERHVRGAQQGRVVFDMARYAGGVYFLRITDGVDETTVKVTIAR